MGTINSALGIIGGALDADQAALGVVANNIANANTPGYSAESPTWRQNTPVFLDGVQVGTGVTEAGSTSRRDRVLLQRLDQQQQLASASTTRLAALNNIQALFTPNSGSSTSAAGDIGTDITNFFDSFSSLQADPTNSALRNQVLSAARLLSGDMSSAARSLDGQQAALDQEAASIAGQVNTLTSAIAQLNLAIQSASPSQDAGALEDQRQQDISQLSQLIGINQVTTEDNGLSITTTAGQLLVSQGQSYQLATGKVNGLTQFYVGGENIAQPDPTAVGGQLGGYLTARDVDLPRVLSSLDQLAYGISTAANQQNNAGTDLAGVSGSGNLLNIFNPPAQVTGSAAAMAVVMADPNQIAAAGAGEGSGDNSNAMAMADLADNARIAPSATTSFSMTQNLSSSTPVGNSVTGATTVYDAKGKSYQAAVTYTNAGPSTTDPTAEQWNYQLSLGGVVAATGSLTFDASGNLVVPAADITGITLSGLSDGAPPLNLTWQLYGAGGGPQLTQTSSASAQTGTSQNGSPGQSPIDFYSSFVSALGSTVAEAQTENTAQSASVSQLQSQSNALSSVNLNDQAAALSLLETSYQAASQVFTILNSIMTSALNLGVETAVA